MHDHGARVEAETARSRGDRAPPEARRARRRSATIAATCAFPRPGEMPARARRPPGRLPIGDAPADLASQARSAHSGRAMADDMVERHGGDGEGVGARVLVSASGTTGTAPPSRRPTACPARPSVGDVTSSTGLSGCRVRSAGRAAAKWREASAPPRPSSGASGAIHPKVDCRSRWFLRPFRA